MIVSVVFRAPPVYFIPRNKYNMIERKHIACVLAALIANVSTIDAFTMSTGTRNHISTSTASTNLHFGPNTAYQEKQSSNVKQASTVHLDHMKEDTVDIMADADFMAALERAKQMDRQYGVWSVPSQQAWETVDQLYAQKGLQP